MKAKDLIEENNVKRKQLDEENLEYYEEMLIYIRLSFSKSEQETEEILSEMLDHLLEAQEEGKTAEEVFGNDPKQYANEIVGELPQMMTKETISLVVMGILYFLSATLFFGTVFNLVIYFVFDKGALVREYYVGSVALHTIVSIPIAFLLLYMIVYYLRWSCFKKINKVLEFFIFWIFGAVSIGLFMINIYLIPDFGSVISMPLYAILIIAIILFIAARIIQKKV